MPSSQNERSGGRAVVALKKYIASSKGRQLKSPDEVDDEVQQRAFQLLMADPRKRDAAMGNPNTIPELTLKRPPTGSLKSHIVSEAKNRALEDRFDELLDSQQLEEVWYMLLGESMDNETFDDKRINYDSFAKIRKKCQEQFGPLADRVFRAATFMRFPQDMSGSISIYAFYQYLTARNQQERTAITLAMHDNNNDGMLTVEEMQAWIGEQLSDGSLPHMKYMDKLFVSHYKQISAHKFAFFHARRGKMLIRDILTSSVLTEWFEMTKPKNKTCPPPSNWFSLESTNRIYKLFTDLDQNMTGSLSKSELSHYSTTMTPIFLSRIFEEHAGRCRTQGGLQKRGEMVFAEFLDFVLAWENKDSEPSMSYFFKIYDLRKQGCLTSVEIYIFLKEVYKMWVDMGYYAELSVGDIKDEIFDMVKPKDKLQITLKELIDSKVGGTVMGLMGDVRHFWEYDNRESLMQQEDEEDS